MATAAFTLAMEGAFGSLNRFDRACRALECGSVAVKAVPEQDRAFREWPNGSPVPLVRVSEKLA